MILLFINKAYLAPNNLIEVQTSMVKKKK